MREIPILMSTPMVIATIEGNKTETRRTSGLDVINEKPNNWVFGLYHAQWTDKKGFPRDNISVRFNHKKNKRKNDKNIKWIKCPYGTVGDVLWVRETFLPLAFGGYAYKASPETLVYITNEKFKPCIHMPKDAARIWLKIKSIGVERLHDIKENDAKLEGVEKNRDGSWHDYLEPDRLFQDDARASFISLWMKINGPKSWGKNPWLWVIKYEVLSTTGKPNNL